MFWWLERHFKMHFLDRNTLYIDSNMQKFYARKMNFGNIYTTIHDFDINASI